MIFVAILIFIFWMLFGKKALAWAIVIGAVIFVLAIFLAPPIPIPPKCTDDLTAVPMKLCPPIGDRI